MDYLISIKVFWHLNAYRATSSTTAMPHNFDVREAEPRKT
jgi:hypothetical protein